MNAMHRFATEGIAPPDRLRYWNDLVDRIYCGTYVECREGGFQSELLSWTVGSLAMARPRSTASFVGRMPRPANQERLILHLQCRGSALHQQAGLESILEPGDFVVGSPHMPYTMDLTAHELVVVEFPRAPLDERVPGLDDMLSRRMSGSSTGGRVFRDFLLSLWHNAALAAHDAEPDEDWGHGVSEVFYDLVALALRSAKRSEPRAGDCSMRERVLALVEAHLQDPDLKTLFLAQACHASIRTIQNVFAAMGTTPSAYILERRMARAADRLMAAPGASITDIAFELGFNDSGYFTRCFRQRFGMAPREWRSGG